MLCLFYSTRDSPLLALTITEGGAATRIIGHAKRFDCAALRLQDRSLSQEYR